MASRKAASNVIPFPVKPAALSEADALWIIAVSSDMSEKYSIEYDHRISNWYIYIKAVSFQSAANLINECRRALGWEQMEEVLQ